MQVPTNFRNPRRDVGYYDTSYGYGVTGYGTGPQGASYGYGYGYGYGGAPEEGRPVRTFSDYLILLRERIWWIIASILICFVAAAIYTFRAQAIYTSAAMIQILPLKNTVQTAVGSETAVNLTPQWLQTQIYILESGDLVTRVFERLTPEKRNELLQPYSGGMELFGKTTERDVLAQNRGISPLRNSYNVRVFYSHPKPELAAEIANLFCEEYINSDVDRSNEVHRRHIEELKSHSLNDDTRISEQLREIRRFQEINEISNLADATSYEQQLLALYTSQHAEAKAALAEFQSRYDALQKYVVEKRPLFELDFIAQNSQVSSLLNTVQQAKISVESMRTKYGPKHPRMIEASKHFDTASKELEKVIGDVSIALNNNYARAKETLASATQRLDSQRKKMVEINQKHLQLVRMEDTLKQLRESRLRYDAEIQRLMTLITTTSETAKFVDRAAPSLNPSSPKPMLNMGVGLAVGVCVGIGLVFASAVFDDRVKTAMDIESGLNLPIIGIIPTIRRAGLEEKGRSVIDNTDNRTVEAFRSILSTIRLGEAGKLAKVILQTSTIPGEGKSFVSANLAQVFAAHGERTILLDCDLRMHNVDRTLDITNSTGLIPLIKQGTTLDQAIQKNVAPNFDVLTTGGRTKNPTQLLNSEEFRSILHELRLRYDRIVIDTPPIGAVSDALNILPVADAVVYVIRYNTVHRKVAETCLSKLRESGTPIIGAILNNITLRGVSHHYQHYYDSSYEDYYLDDVSEPDHAENTATGQQSSTEAKS